MGPVFLAASSCAADRRGRIIAPAELSAPDVLTEASTGSVCLAAVRHRWPARRAMELLARDWDPPVRSARPCQVVPGWLQPRQNYMGDALGRLRVGSDPRVPPPASPGAPRAAVHKQRVGHGRGVLECREQRRGRVGLFDPDPSAEAGMYHRGCRRLSLGRAGRDNPIHGNADDNLPGPIGGARGLAQTHPPQSGQERPLVLAQAMVLRSQAAASGHAAEQRTRRGSPAIQIGCLPFPDAACPAPS